MKLIEQSVRLIGLMFPTDDGGVMLPGSNPEQLIEVAGRTCYKSEDKITADSHKAFIAMLKKRGHEAMLEHSCAAFRCITDTGITHEIVRHRLASYAQESTRYVNYSKEAHGSGVIQFLLPLDLTEGQYGIFRRGYEAAEAYYNEAIAAGCKPEQARDILPKGVKTEIIWTTNFREWRHIRGLRKSKAAHPKMRQLMGMIDERLTKVAPATFFDEPAAA
jgi:thymidylate synthase (FAD)